VQLFRDYDKWLSLHPTRQVIIPYYPEVVETLHDPPVIFRRYINESFPALIQASALMHHYHRAETDEGIIIANLDDYGHAYEVMSEVIQRELGGSAPSPTQQQILEWVDEQLQDSKSPVVIASSRTIGLAIGLPATTIRNNIRTMVQQGLLENLEISQGKPYKLKLSRGGEGGAIAGLITPEKLAEIYKKDI
jgi:hypothetical protein